MPLFAVTFPVRKSRFWLIRTAVVAALLVPGAAQVKADTRIDQNTATSRDLQVAGLQKGPGGVVQQAGVAAWYGKHWRGRKTASGMVFDERQLTAASLILPLATRARVTNMQNGRSVDVLVNDRGPYAGNRVMDLSERAATALGMTKSGLAQVVIRARLAKGGGQRHDVESRIKRFDVAPVAQQQRPVAQPVRSDRGCKIEVGRIGARPCHREHHIGVRRGMRRYQSRCGGEKVGVILHRVRTRRQQDRDLIVGNTERGAAAAARFGIGTQRRGVERIRDMDPAPRPLADAFVKMLDL